MTRSATIPPRQDAGARAVSGPTIYPRTTETDDPKEVRNANAGTSIGLGFIDLADRRRRSRSRGARRCREGPRRHRCEVARDTGWRHVLLGRAKLQRRHGLAAVQRAEPDAADELRHGVA